MADAADVASVVGSGAVAAQVGTAFLLADEAGTNPVHRAALDRSRVRADRAHPGVHGPVGARPREPLHGRARGRPCGLSPAPPPDSSAPVGGRGGRRRTGGPAPGGIASRRGTHRLRPPRSPGRSPPEPPSRPRPRLLRLSVSHPTCRCPGYPGGPPRLQAAVRGSGQRSVEKPGWPLGVAASCPLAVAVERRAILNQVHTRTPNRGGYAAGDREGPGYPFGAFSTTGGWGRCESASAGPTSPLAPRPSGRGVQPLWGSGSGLVSPSGSSSGAGVIGPCSWWLRSSTMVACRAGLKSSVMTSNGLLVVVGLLRWCRLSGPCRRSGCSDPGRRR